MYTVGEKSFLGKDLSIGEEGVLLCLRYVPGSMRGPRRRRNRVLGNAPTRVLYPR